MNDGFKSAFIAVLGRPNAGKSTLINRIVGEKISIVSKKPQTTRNKILGILTEENCQYIFVDTPGVHKDKTKLGKYMNDAAFSSAGDADGAVLMIDAQKGIGTPEERIAEELKKDKIPTVLGINKSDSVKKEELLPLIAEASAFMDFEAIVPLSALTGDGVSELMKELSKFLEEGPMYFPEDSMTDKTEREIAAEIIREKLLRLLQQEIPHGTAVEILEMKDKGSVISINANIFCEKESHKSIIIVKN